MFNLIKIMKKCLKVSKISLKKIFFMLSLNIKTAKFKLFHNNLKFQPQNYDWF